MHEDDHYRRSPRTVKRAPVNSGLLFAPAGGAGEEPLRSAVLYVLGGWPPGGVGLLLCARCAAGRRRAGAEAWGRPLGRRVRPVSGPAERTYGKLSSPARRARKYRRYKPRRRRGLVRRHHHEDRLTMGRPPLPWARGARSAANEITAARGVPPRTIGTSTATPAGSSDQDRPPRKLSGGWWSP